jgi:RNA polymerase sigma factor (sigma-70 family)
MATVHTSAILIHVRRLAASGLQELSDAHLLARFASRRDEAAFTALVRRHGPMVLGVCRRVLRDWHLAQDCFQLTFLVLARKADSLRRPDALGPWLYGVAYRTARKARTQAARRRQVESHVQATEAVHHADETEWNDLRSVLDESVSALPDKYRVPFVLHYLQGMTVTEVARRLGCPRGSVATRLLRARERLRTRLMRRGVVLSASGLLMALSEASASVPAPLAALTARAAAEACLSPVSISPRIEGVVQFMRTTKGKIAVAGLMLTALCGVGTGLFVHRTRAADPEQAKVPALAVAGPRKDNKPPKPRLRYLSLAEARAIALENAFAFHPPLLRIDGLEGLGLQPRDAASIRVLADVTAKGRGIVLTGIPRDVPRAKLELYVNQMLLNVETAYWNLYGSYWHLHTREQGLRLAHETWKTVRDKYNAGRVSLADLAQSEGQYNLFRSQRMQALEAVLDNERQLRAIVGMPPEDHNPLAKDEPFKIKVLGLAPSDAPSLVEKKPDWDKALATALKERPEVRLARQDVSRTQEDTPQRQRARLVLQDQELKTQRFLGLYCRRLTSTYAQIQAARKQREAFATQLHLRNECYEAGEKDASLDLLLESRSFWADSLATEFNAIVAYNNALAGWEFVQGAIMDRAHVRFDDNPPPRFEDDFLRAALYEQLETLASVKRVAAAAKADDAAISLPSLWKTSPLLRGAEELPPAESIDRKKRK